MGGEVDCGNQIDVIVTSFHFAQPLLYKSLDHGTYMKRKRWCISPSIFFDKLAKFRRFHGSIIIIISSLFFFALLGKNIFRKRHKTQTMKMDQVKIYSLNFFNNSRDKIFEQNNH